MISPWRRLRERQPPRDYRSSSSVGKKPRLGNPFRSAARSGRKVLRWMPNCWARVKLADRVRNDPGFPASSSTGTASRDSQPAQGETYPLRRLIDYALCDALVGTSPVPTTPCEHSDWCPGVRPNQTYVKYRALRIQEVTWHPPRHFLQRNHTAHEPPHPRPCRCRLRHDHD